MTDPFIYLFGVLRRFQHCTGHITTGSWKGRGNQYIQFARVLYCKLPTNGKQLPAFPLEAVPGIEPRPQRWEARVLPLCHRGPFRIRLKIGSGNNLMLIKEVQLRNLKFKGGSVDIYVKERVKWDHEFVLAGNTKDRITYNQLNITQWTAGFCRIMKEENCRMTKDHMLDYLIALLDDSNDFF